MSTFNSECLGEIINLYGVINNVIPKLPPAGRLFGKAWREEFVVLYEDSSVIWEEDHSAVSHFPGELTQKPKSIHI